MSRSLVPRLPLPLLPLLLFVVAVRSANDRKLDGAWGARLVNSESMYELSFVTVRNGHRVKRND